MKTPDTVSGQSAIGAGKRFEGKVAIVTGAAGDIGREAALRFAGEGAAIVAVDLETSALEGVIRQIEALGARAIGVSADVTRADDVRAYVGQAVEAFAGIDILFNNAGVEGAVSPVEAYPEDVFDQVIGVNVRGVFLGMKYVVPELRKRGGGVIINTASVAGMSGAAGVSAYNASKHAVIGLTRSVAVELGPENIRVNAVCPSPIDGRMMRSLEDGLMPEGGQGEARAQMITSIPMQRYGKPSDVANLVTFLCSEEAAFLNGGVYTVDGGMTA